MHIYSDSYRLLTCSQIAKIFWHNEKRDDLTVLSLWSPQFYPELHVAQTIFFLTNTGPRCQAVEDIYLYIWFLGGFDKPLCWQLQKCLWAYYMVNIPNWLGHLVAIIWVYIIFLYRGKNGSFCPTTDVLDKWLVAFDLQSTQFLKDSPDWGLNSTPTIHKPGRGGACF